MKYGVPISLRIHERIDFYLWVMTEVATSGPKSPLDKVIDDASGKTAADLTQLKKLGRHVSRLKRLYDRATKQPKEQENGNTEEE